MFYDECFYLIFSPWCDISLEDVREKIFKDQFKFDPQQSLHFALNTMICLTSAVSYLHNVVKVKHLDLKPANILLLEAKNPLVYIVDFGSSHAFSKDSRRIPSVVSQDYSAPEQVAKIKCGRSSDLFSLGAVFLFLLANSSPKYSFSKMKNTALRALPKNDQSRSGFENRKVWASPKAAELLLYAVFKEDNFGNSPLKTVADELRQFVPTLLVAEAPNRPTAFDTLKNLQKFYTKGGFTDLPHCSDLEKPRTPDEEDVISLSSSGSEESEDEELVAEMRNLTTKF